MPNDDTTAALKALIQQVAALTETVQKQDEVIRGVKDHNSRLLDQVKDAKRAPDIFDKLDQQEQARKDDLANLVRNPDGSRRLKSGPGDNGGEVVLSREAARNSATYREAKARAASRGVPLRIASDGEDPTMRNNDHRAQVVQSKTFTFDDTLERIRYVRADMQTGAGIIQRRLAAEREGFTVRTFNTPDDLPAHARDQFTQLEATANAKSDS